MPFKKTLLIDFDGVLHQYDGNFGPQLNPPLNKARHSCFILEKTFKLVCFTTRPVEQVEPWLKKWGFPKMLVTNEKLPAHCILDDRCVLFNGVWTQELLDQIKTFRPWWRSASDVEETPDTDHQTFEASEELSSDSG